MHPLPSRIRALAVPLLLSLAFAPLPVLADAHAVRHAQAASGYQVPVAELQAIVDAPRPPQLMLGPKRDLAALMQVPSLPSIALVAQPELKLAGLRLNPRAYAPSRFTFGTDLWLLDLKTRQEIRIAGLPQPLSLASVSWSPDQRHLALVQQDPATGGNALWLVDVAARKARRLVEQPLNTAMLTPRWMPDGRQLLVGLRIGGAAPEFDVTPAGPNVQQTAAGAGVRQLRTYQDMLRSENDALVLEHYLRVQPALVDLRGKVRNVGGADLYLGLSPSPDGRHLLRQVIERPFSYVVPASYFPRRIEVLDLQGRPLRSVARLPLFEGLPSGNDAVPTGVRSIAWRSDAPATLVWAEAQDGGDPAKAAGVRDVVYAQAAPFDAAPVALARLASRYAGTTWGRGDVALVDEYWWKTRQQKQWRIAPDAPATAPQLLHSGSSEDRYNDPGNPVTVTDANGFPRLLFAEDGQSIYLDGEGASAEGDRPFLDRFHLGSHAKTRVFHSQAPVYENVAAVLDPAATQLLTTRESPAAPANFHLRNGHGEPLALTAFAHPTPQLKDVRKEQIRYRRADGVELTATLYLPPGFEPGRDKPLPLLMWAYPAEFKSAAAASQVTDSPLRFNAIGYMGPLPWLARGYAVLDDPSMPIVGEGDAEPNDTYLAQLVASAQAAVDEVVRRGVADRDRIAVGGHSYGAFMTANLLAHSRLFKAGIARSGAYNRSLTPFGFQAEERNYWDAKDTYQAMSPFNHAEKIKDALLLIHGEQDNNSGTFPMQSERMFAAIKGLGGNARLVMLPNESHGYRARESVLHMLAETDAWLEKHVKQTPTGEGAAAVAR